MKIEHDKYDNKKSLEYIDCGDCFEYQGNLYIVIDSESCDFDKNKAVRLKDGKEESLDFTTKVTPVVAEVHYHE